MIIYQAMAGRLYPKILDSILDGIDLYDPDIENKQIKEFHYPYLLCNENDYRDSNDILKMIPATLKHERFEGILYGVFSTSNLNKKQEDLHFTIINHPVDQIYELFAYWNFATNKKFLDEANKLSLDAINKLSLDERISMVFKANQYHSLEEYIDMILNDIPIYFYYNGIKYQPIKELFYGYENIKDFNYIGKFSEIKKTCKSLSELLDCYIKPFNEEQITSYRGNYYKRDLLEKMLKDQLEIYESIKC
jgi:hypothetical protein